MVTKAKKALLASLAAFLCVMLTVFGLSMSASTAKIAKADETAIVVNETNYNGLDVAFNNADPVNGVITYEIYGKHEIGKTGWIEILKSGLTDVTKVEFVGKNATAEISLTGGLAILADQQYDIDVSFKNLTLSKLNPTWGGDYGHSTNYFTTWLRNKGASENTVTYTNCTFPNGVCNNQYGKTVFTNCEYTNATTGLYNMWVYGGEVEIVGGKFTGTRGAKVYTEGTPATAPTVTVSGTSFEGLNEKAAIVVSKAATVELDKVTTTGCAKGTLQKDIGTGVTITANGTGISGSFNIVANTDAATVKNELNITGGAFSGEVPADYCADNVKVKQNADGSYRVGSDEVKSVAKVGDTEYNTLADAFAALSSENYTLTLLDESVWYTAKPVYWKAGTQSGYVAKLTDALTAAYKANAGDIVIVCRPGADVGTMNHGHVADSISIYGNNAYISGGECDLEVDKYKFSRTTGTQTNDGAYLEKNITINAYELDNLGVWGERHTAYTVNVNLTDCDGKEIAGNNNLQRVYISGTTGVNNLTIQKCDFLTKATSIYSNADGKIVVSDCTFTGAQAPLNINHKADGAVTLKVTSSTFTSCGDAGEWKKFAAPARFVNSGSGTMTVTANTLTFSGTVGSNGDILLGDGREGEKSNKVKLKVTNTAAKIQAQKPGYYNADGTTNETKGGTLVAVATESYTTTVEDLAPEKGSEKNPYTLKELGAMTRAEYIAAQEKLGGTMYVTVGNYSYDKNGVLGNGVRNDTPGQVPDHSKLNAYGENGYLGENNDGANGKNIVFVGGSITSGATGYKSIDKIGTSLLLAVPAYTNVTFKGTTFNNVMSFDYQLYTSPWSQLGELKFDGCTFNGLIVGAIASQTLTFNGCTFTNYTNTTSANNSNPTWIRPAYGNWTKGDNEGQGGDFKSLTTINFTGNNVTSTRPVKFERIAQWEMATTVTATKNTFTISAQDGDTSTKNVGLYLGANAKFGLVVEGNQKSGSTAALYTAVYSAPSGVSYAGLPAGSTVTDTKGNGVTVEDAYEWKTTKKLTLETTTEVASVTNAKGVTVNFATLQAAIDAATRNATVTLLANTKENVTITKALTLDLNGYTINGGTVKGKPAVTVKARTVTIKDSSAAQTGTIMREDTAGNSGVSSHYVIDVQGNSWLVFESGNVINNSGNEAGKGASLVRVGDDSVAEYPGLNIKGGTFTQDNFIVIKVDRGDLFLNGGTLNSANSYAIENWHRATVKGGTVNGAVSSWTYSSGLNSDLTISGGTINGNVESVTYDEAAGKLAKVSITGGTVTGTLSNKVYSKPGDADKAMATIEVSGGTFSIDPSKYVVEESAITENADGTFGVEKAYLVKVGDTSYYTMDEAFKAQTASGEAIVMLRDYTTGSTFNSGSMHRVVDLNRHTWTYTGTDMNSAAFEINYPNVTLTVKNGTIISSTIVGLIPSAMGGTITYDNAGLVFENVKMTSNGSSGIETNGNNTDDSVTLINSTLNVPNGFGIYFPSSGTLTINNSTITAKTMGVQVCSGELNINAGSAITVTGDAVPKTENDGAIQDGAAISIVNRTGYKGLSNIVITGGTFTAKAGNDAIKAYDWNNAENKGSDFTKADLVAVSGGTFSSEVEKDYLANGFVVNKNTDGTYGVTAGSGFVGTYVVVTESLAMKVVVGTASKYVVVTYKGLDGIDKSVKLDTLTDGYYLFDRIMPQMIDVKFSFELYGENDVMLDRKANYSVVDYLADIIKRGKDSTEFRNVAASLIEYANRAKAVKGLATIAPEFVKGTEKVDLTELYKTFIADEKNKIPAKDTVKAEDISKGDAQVIYKAKVVFDDAYTLKFYTNAGDGYTYTLSKNGSTEEEGITFDKNGEFTINVLAQDITTQYVIKVYGEDKTKPVQTVTYGVSTYCIRMQETKTPQGELYVASYYYGVAVQQYGAANAASVK